MLSIEVDLDAGTPIYQQIADGIRELIARGSLVDGAVLPSVRALGRQVGVNLNTVARAYRILADEGLVELKQGAPAKVATAPRERRVDGAMLDDDARRKLFDLFSRWILDGANKRQIERVLKTATAEYFR